MIIGRPLQLVTRAAAPIAQKILTTDAERKFYDSLKLPEFTPDIARLERFETQFFFNYTPGLLKDIPAKHKDDRGNVFTYEDNFILWKKNLGELSYPIPMEYGQSMPADSDLKKVKDQHSSKGLLYPPARVAGHLVKLVYPGHWFKEVLDPKMGNTKMFTRQRVKIMIPYHTYITREKATHTRSGAAHTGMEPMVAYVWAWMYLGEPKAWKDQIAISDNVMTKPLVSPLHPFHAKNRTVGEYYCFTEEHLKGFPVLDDKEQPIPTKKIGSIEDRRKRLAALNNDLTPALSAETILKEKELNKKDDKPSRRK